MKKKKVIFLSSIILTLLVFIGGTFAWLTWTLNKTAMVLTIGNVDDIQIKIYPYQTNEVLNPITTLNYSLDDDNIDDNDNFYISIDAVNNKSVSTVFGVYFKINNIDESLLSQNFVYVIRKSVNGGAYTDYANGDFSHALDDNKMYILEELIEAGDTCNYRVYIYINGLNGNNSGISNASVNMELRGALETKGTDYVSLLYTEDNQSSIYTVDHAAILAANSGTGEDIAATTDYRYTGSNPNNYVCLDFEGNTTCPEKHLYRIIGIVRNDYTGKNELKLIKADKIVGILVEESDSPYGYAWDQLYENVDGSNEWSRSTLNNIVTNAYYNSSVVNNHYDPDYMDYYTLSFANTGLSAKARSLLDKARYYLGGSEFTTTATANNYYTLERGNAKITNPSDGINRELTWDGYIGLPYVSDFGYMTLGTCYMREGTTPYCQSGAWILNGKSAQFQWWAINTVLGYDKNSNYWFNYSWLRRSFDTTYYVDVLPTVYLKNNVAIVGGLGTQTYPYRVDIEASGEDILYGNDPVLVDGLIPITFSNKTGSEVKVADTSKKWYSYKNKEWANAVLVTDNGTHGNGTTREYYQNNPGVTIASSDILAYYVWIPRYSYKVWQYSGVSATGREQEIEIKFVPTSIIENATKNGEWYTHPAFWWDKDNDNTRDSGEELTGIWVGKFETSHTTLSSSTTVNNLGTDSGTICNSTGCDNYTGLRILPNVYSLRYNRVSNFFNASRFMESSGNPFGLDASTVDSHLIKNSEWGAVAYLSHSKYGINEEVRLNNQNKFTTGCGAATENATYSTTCSNTYGTQTVYPQSTTGNVTGLFDMSGGTHEYVMGFFYPSPYGLSGGFSNTYPLPDSKYINTYAGNTSYNTCTLDICGGHALNETKNWYSDSSSWINSSFMWFYRGGNYDKTTSAGLFYASEARGNDVSSRLVLIQE